MIRYLTGVTSDELEASVELTTRCDLLVQPGNQYTTRTRAYRQWGGDNGAFGAGRFDPARFRAMLTSPDLADNSAACRFIVAPDVLHRRSDGSVIGDAAATLAQFDSWANEIREFGFPVALVAQDGLERMLDRVPWDDVDVLFIGGSTEWKLGEGARLAVGAALAQCKPVHMGRVNSLRRLRYAQSIGCSTADGTFLKYGPATNLPRLLVWLDQLEPDGVYLAGAINRTGDAQQVWRRDAAAALDARGIRAVDPLRRDYRGTEDQNVDSIVHGDLADIRHCRAMIALAERPSWGTAMEIGWAFSQSIPVFSVVGPGAVSPWLRYHTTVCATLDDAVARAVALFCRAPVLCGLLGACACRPPPPTGRS